MAYASSSHSASGGAVRNAALRWLRLPTQRANSARIKDVEVVLAGEGGRVDLVISALRDDNPGSGLSVVDRGHDVAVRAPDRIVLTAATLMWHLGRGFDLRRLLRMVVSCVGRMEVGRDELVWTSRGVPDASGPGRSRHSAAG